MLRYLLRRLISLALSLWVASLAIFAVIEVLPGDPASFMLGINATPDTVAALRHEIGLAGAGLSRYLGWVGGMLIGDLGTSYTYRVPVSELVAARAWVSLPLVLYGLMISTLIAIPAGVIAASRRGRAADLGIMATTQLGIAVPNFHLGIILVLIFAVRLGWFASGGFPGWEAGLWAGLKALTLPAISIALFQASVLTRITRSSVLETLDQDYLRTARAKGLSRGQAVWRHALPNALIPVLTILGLQVSYLIAGAVLVENVFFLPGLGRLVFQAITQRDLIVVESVVMLLVFGVIVVNFLTDIAYALADPRLRHGT